MTVLRPIFIILLAVALLSCSSDLDSTDIYLPKGTSKGYRTVRLTSESPHQATPARYQDGQRLIRKALEGQFRTKGLQVTTGPADLLVGHLVIVQDGIMTTSLDEYFGSGIEAKAISDLAHQRGVDESGGTGNFKKAGLVIDVMDARTQKLVFRNYVKRDLLPAGTPDATRRQIIDQAVAETLAPFFR